MTEDRQELEDWLAGLRGQQQEESAPPVAESSQEQPGQADTEDLQRPMSQADLLEDLREQIILTEDELEYERRPPVIQFFLDLEPSQRLVLAILLFLNVGVCGCMGLVMAGRVVVPF